jgi:hypothetical protein
MTASETPPFQHIYDLGDLGRSGAEIRVEASGDERARIANWADIRAVTSFGAMVQLRRNSADRFVLDADFVADIIQDCVVTLEPVAGRIAKHVHRELQLGGQVRIKHHETVSLGVGAGDDEVPEEIDRLAYDLAAPLLEEFALAIDPYPRAPGVEFAPPAEPQDRPESPFAVLKSLQKRT